MLNKDVDDVLFGVAKPNVKLYIYCVLARKDKYQLWVLNVAKTPSRVSPGKFEYRNERFTFFKEYMRFGGRRQFAEVAIDKYVYPYPAAASFDMPPTCDRVCNCGLVACINGQYYDLKRCNGYMMSKCGDVYSSFTAIGKEVYWLAMKDSYGCYRVVYYPPSPVYKPPPIKQVWGADLVY